MNSIDLLKTAFGAYNRRDSEGLLALIADDVVWQTLNGTLRGKAQLVAFWTRQWRETRTLDQVLEIKEIDDDSYVVLLDQAVRTIDGKIISSGLFDYTFVLRNGKISALEKLQARPPKAGHDRSSADERA